jgi:hypothetical protein
MYVCIYMCVCVRMYQYPTDGISRRSASSGRTVATTSLISSRYRMSLYLLGYGLVIRGIVVRFLAGARDFSLLQSVHSVSGAHAASYSLIVSGAFAGVTAVVV